MIQRYLLIILISCSATGCLGWQSSTANATGPKGVFKSAGLQRISAQEYRVDPPDQITLHSTQVKEYDNWKITVRPDGMITVPLAGEIQVTGLTPSQIADKLARAATEQGYKQLPIVGVEVTPQSKFYYVFGFGAQKTGRMPYNGGVTVVGALAEAGFTITSWPQQVRISRPAGQGHDKATVVVDFTRVWDHGDVSQNYLIEEGDVIFIPITPLAVWGEATRELFEPLTGPAGLAVTTTTAGRGGL